MNNTEICNLALSYIGKGSIASIEENNENARQCKLHYDHQRKMLLRDYNWGFAKRIVTLAEVNTKIPGWKYVYKYPAACLAVRRIFNDNMMLPARDTSQYEIMIINDSDTVLCSNIENAKCEYTYDVTNGEVFTSEFDEALARALASALCLALNGNEQLQQTQYNLMMYALNKARVTTAKEQDFDQLEPNRYVKARY